MFEIILCRPLNSQITGRFLSYFRNRDFQFSAEICSCNGLRILHKFLSSAHSNKLSTMFSCAGSDIYNTVRFPHGILIVRHYDQGVAQISEVFQCGKQLSLSR